MKKSTQEFMIETLKKESIEYLKDYEESMKDFLQRGICGQGRRGIAWSKEELTWICEQVSIIIKEKEGK